MSAAGLDALRGMVHSGALTYARRGAGDSAEIGCNAFGAEAEGCAREVHNHFHTYASLYV